MKINRVAIEESIHLSKGVARYNLVEMITFAMKKLAERGCQKTEQMLGSGHVIGMIMDAENISYIRDNLNELVCQLCNTANEINSGQNTCGIEESVAQFITKNYSNSEINVKIIADHFSMTPAYLSQKFKQRYVVSILDYIVRVRIESAQELLISSKESIEHIFTKCGYISETTFMRQFKKITGVTPGKFRGSE
jgi:YesN/AraC family two-component response regulator